MSYETALRDCLVDCKALFEAQIKGTLASSFGIGEVKAIVRDIGLLLNREDCPVYEYKKGE